MRKIEHIIEGVRCFYGFMPFGFLKFAVAFLLYGVNVSEAKKVLYLVYIGFMAPTNKRHNGIDGDIT